MSSKIDSVSKSKSKSNNSMSDKKNKLRRNHQDSDSDSDYTEELLDDDSEYSDEDFDDESSEYETIDSDESSNRNKKKLRNKKSKNHEEEYSDEEDEELDRSELRKYLSKIFPSKYMSKKVKKDDKIKKLKKMLEEESEDESEEISSSDEKLIKKMKQKYSSKKSKSKDKKDKTSKKSNKKQNKKKHVDTETESDSENDSDYEYNEDIDDDGKEKKLNIIFSIGDGMEDEYLDYSDEETSLNNIDENEECNSEDEKTFMKENYQKVSIPEEENKETECDEEESKTDKKGDKKSKNKSKKNKKEDKKDKDENKIEEHESADIEGEYVELLELKKNLNEKLMKKPKSKILRNAIDQCTDSINKLIKNARLKNTKLYHKLIHGSNKNKTNEMDYFRKKLSNKEQLRIVKDLKEINEHMFVDKPYRLSLLQSKIPPNLKAIAMQKLNMLRSMEPGDSEYHKIKNWVDTFMKIPFGVNKNLSINMDDGIEVSNNFLENAKKTLDECVYGLDDAKMQIMQMLGQWIANPTALGTAIAIKGPPGTGKCLAYNTPILMYDGSIKKVQDIREGDVIMGDDSTPRNILSLASGNDEMYDIIYPDGDKYTVNSEHILCLIPYNLNYLKEKEKNGKIKYVVKYFNKYTLKMDSCKFNKKEHAEEFLSEKENEIIDISIKEYLSIENKTIQQSLHGYRTRIEFPANKIPFDAYTLGNCLTSVEYIKYSSKHNNFCNLYNKIINHFGFDSRKEIPSIYKYNSFEIRKNVLLGLIEGYMLRSDCCYHEKIKTISIKETCKTLSDDIVFVARSIGIDVSYKKDSNYIYLKDIDEEFQNIPFYNLYEINVVPIGKDEYYGFEIDGNRRFVLNDFTVTHNTSLIKDGISKILGREFTFIALGGAGDASFLEGHSYTYEGSTWGKIVQILIDSKCMNPVIYFDELDKISDSARGQEIIGILTHLTDTSQNSQFHDKYFSEINFDLSKCLFIFSYNDESLVNPILKDRMYRIETKGYEMKEKTVIARNYLLPKIREQVNFKEGEVIIPDDTIQYIINNQGFTKNEDGVRNLKRCLEIIHTKLNLFRLVKPENNLFSKQVDINVTFPFTVLRKHVDIFIKNEESQKQSILAMYV
jgi:ATP-dependent Lon protease